MDPSSYINVGCKKACNDESWGNELVATSITFIIIGAILTILRAWARRLQQTPFMWSDVFVPASLMVLIAMCVTAIVVVGITGLGHHTFVIGAYMELTSDLIWRFYDYILLCLYYVAVVLPKLAVLDLYLHIFRERWMRWCCYGVGISMLLNFVIFLFMAIFACMNKEWCSTPHYLWSSLLNIITDVVMLVLPIPVALKLQVPVRIKIGVFFTFFTGNIGLGASLARFISFSYNALNDPFWALKFPIIWSIVEPGVYLIAACLITLKPLIHFLFSEETPPARVIRRSSGEKGRVCQKVSRSESE